MFKNSHATPSGPSDGPFPRPSFSTTFRTAASETTKAPSGRPEQGLCPPTPPSQGHGGPPLHCPSASRWPEICQPGRSDPSTWVNSTCFATLLGSSLFSRNRRAVSTRQGATRDDVREFLSHGAKRHFSAQPASPTLHPTRSDRCKTNPSGAMFGSEFDRGMACDVGVL